MLTLRFRKIWSQLNNLNSLFRIVKKESKQNYKKIHVINKKKILQFLKTVLFNKI